MGYKLIQIGHALFGTGDTPEDARDDAREWLDSPEYADDVEVYDSMVQIKMMTVYGDLVIVPDSLADELGVYE